MAYLALVDVAGFNPCPPYRTIKARTSVCSITIFTDLSSSTTITLISTFCITTIVTTGNMISITAIVTIVTITEKLSRAPV